MVNKKVILLFFLSLLIINGESLSSVVTKRSTIKLTKPGVINCEKVNDLIIECDSSSEINFTNKEKISPIKSISFVSKNKLNIFLEDSGWEFFSFSKPGKTKEYVLDFWKKSNKKTPKVKVVKDVVKNKVSGGKKSKNKRIKRNKKEKLITKSEKEKNLDFRYGSVFIWPYKAVKPFINMEFDYKRKTPDQLIKIKDRDVEKNDEEAHLQLTYNLFKKMKWGLMYKSIDLFNQKYPKSKNQDFNEFLKLNSLLKERYINGNTSPTKELISRLKLYTETSDNDHFNLAITQYLLAHYVETKNVSMILEVATNLYVLARDNYYPEILSKSLEYILASLAEKGDIEKIDKLLTDKDVQKFLPNLRVKEFKTYALLEKNKSERIVLSEKNKKSKRLGDLPKSLLFNLAEAYFREANYKKSIKLFDKFIAKFSEDNYSSKARLRLALAYDLLGRDISLVQKLYKNAIDRSSNIEDRYEAAIRLVGVNYLRSTKKMSSIDAVTFLEVPKELKDKNMSVNLKKILWLTRLRSFIVGQKYNLAFDYYNNIPLESIKIEDRNIFFGDFSEVILGKMYESFNQKNYSDVVKTFSLLEDRKNYFVPKRAGHSYIESASYLSLGVQKSSSESLKKAKEIDSGNDVYPSWVTRNILKELRDTIQIVRFELSLKNDNYQNSLKELNLIKDKKLKKQLELELNFRHKRYTDYIKKAEAFILNDYNKKLTIKQQSSFVTNYSFALMMKGEFTKTKKVLLASFENKLFSKNKSDNLEYVLLNLVEFYSSPKYSDSDFTTLLSMYNQSFPNGEWRSKVDFISAKRSISKGDDDLGIKNLQKVINNKGTKNYLKELAKSELALMKIKQKTI